MKTFLKQLRCKMLVWLTHNMALPFLKMVRNEKRFPYNEDELASFPAGTLGKELQLFLQEKNLQLLPHYARHDIKHILLSYDTTEDGEVCLQCFMLGNGHLSFPVLATVIYGFVTMPEYWGLFRKAYTRGRQALEIKNWDWYNLLPSATLHLQHLIDPNNTCKNERNDRI